MIRLAPLRFAPLLSALLALLAPGCALSDAAGPRDDGAAASDPAALGTARCTSVYRPALKAALARAEQELATLPTPYAQELRDALAAGEIRALPFCDMRTSDYTELRKYHDFDTPFPVTAPRQFSLLKTGDAAFTREVFDAFAGFQWDDRAYISSAQSAAELLETLAHEGKHVLRKAHLADYTDPRNICVEELAAYEAEILVLRTEVTAEERAAIHVKLRELFDLRALRADSCDPR